MLLAEKIRTLRSSAGLSQAEAARRAGLDRSKWVSHETNSKACRNPTMQTLDALARGIGVTIPVLMDGVVVHGHKHADAEPLLGDGR